MNPIPHPHHFSTGRVCVNSENEANDVVDKITGYESHENYGFWKKKIMYVADDGWTTEQNQGQEGSFHTSQSEEIAEQYTPKDYEKKKIYIVTYPTVKTPEGRRKPGANADIVREWNDGKLVVNKEKIMKKEIIKRILILVPLLLILSNFSFVVF